MGEDAAADTHPLRSLWDEAEAARLADRPLDLLRYRSNLLGADLRITNFGGGNTSSKIDLPDPLTGRPVRVLAVKGSGGDLRSITSSGFALLDLDKVESLVSRYRGEAHEDDMVGLYYPNPDGPMTYCLNSKLARAHVRLDIRGRPPVSLHSRAAALEVGTRDSEHGVRMYV